MSQEEIIDSQSFIDMYGLEAPVRFANGTEMTLGQALQFEKMMCPAASEQQDTSKRIGFLAGMLAAAGSLRPEHEIYLPIVEQ